MISSFLSRIKKKQIQTLLNNRVTNLRYINQYFIKKINYKEYKKIRTVVKRVLFKKVKNKKIKK